MNTDNKTQIKNKLLANAEANQRAAYFLINHVARDSNDDVVNAAKHLSSALRKRAAAYLKKVETLDSKE